MNIKWKALAEAAATVRNQSYSPYSKFSVGAALLDSSGTIHLGTNVENISFGLTLCAERAAVVAAVALGVQRFQAIAIVADSKTPISPCGACRQVLSEFGDFPVRSINLLGEHHEAQLSELLPRPRDGILDHQQG